MDGGRGRYRGGGRQSHRSTGKWVAVAAVEARTRLDHASLESGSSKVGSINSEVAAGDGVTRKIDTVSLENPCGPNSESLHSFTVLPNDDSFKVLKNVPGTKPKSVNASSTSPCYDNDFPSLSTKPDLDARSSIFIQSQDQDVENQSSSDIFSTPIQTVRGQLSPGVHSGKTAYGGTSEKNKLDSSDSQHNGVSFDICKERDGKVVTLKTSLHIKNKALRNEKRRMQGDNIQILGPGMILMKGYIPLMEQVKLVKSCRDLGRGPGGFYQPGYRDGTKLHLKMMCLGKNWDPETRKYDDTRPIDRAKPPPIPNEFQLLVKEAIEVCNRYLESNREAVNSRKLLPVMSPNICIINYYTSSGKLGLHQDKDESRESILKGLPVVSFSLGDTSEFLFGDSADVDKADKVTLESGDVLIFGGESRLIFHGVSKIITSTAPQALLEETYLKPGRLNLTFREY